MRDERLRPEGHGLIANRITCSGCLSLRRSYLDFDFDLCSADGSLGSRSYLAGEWELIGDNQEHDGLRQFFLFLIDNRDVSKDGKRGGMKVTGR